jgi:hypothetical protein
MRLVKGKVLVQPRKADRLIVAKEDLLGHRTGIELYPPQIYELLEQLDAALTAHKLQGT